LNRLIKQAEKLREDGSEESRLCRIGATLKPDGYAARFGGEDQVVRHMLDDEALTRWHCRKREKALPPSHDAYDRRLVRGATRVVDAAGKRGIRRRVDHVDLDSLRGESAANGTRENGQARGEGAAIPVAVSRCPGASSNFFRFCSEISPAFAKTN
jgi:hypothetical protein